MALVICPECNKEISDSVKKCPHCGYKLKKQKKKKEPKMLTTPKRKKMFAGVLIVVIVALLGIGGFFGYEYYLIPLNNYKTAETLLKDNKFDDALGEFEKLANFKDSKTRALEVHYKKAEYLLASQSYEEAVSEFKNAGNYENAIERVKETKYEWASDADVDKAIELYEELGDYQDSEDKLEKAQEEKKKYSALERLKTAYNMCSSDGVTLSSDERSMTVDSIGEFDIDAMLDIQTIIKQLGLPDSLYDEMCYTNSLMGRQTETYDYYEVSWSYHPDNGLDVIFKYKN